MGLKGFSVKLVLSLSKYPRNPCARITATLREPLFGQLMYSLDSFPDSKDS
jgi:hypothetical protein